MNEQSKPASVTGLPEMGPFVKGGMLTPEQLNELYPLLQMPFPPGAVQHASKDDTKKQYDMTSYKVQYIINRLNEVLGPPHYHFTFMNESVVEGMWGQGQNRTKCYTYRTDVSMEFGNWQNGQFVPIAQNIGIGEHTASTFEDAKKGARSGAKKHAAAGFGIGRQTYEGALDEEYRKLHGNPNNGQRNNNNQNRYQNRGQGNGQYNQGPNQNPSNGQNGQGRYQGQPDGQNQGRYQGQPNGQNSQGRSQGQSNGQNNQGRSLGQPNGQNTQGRSQGMPNGQNGQGRNQGQTPPPQSAPDIYTGSVKLKKDMIVTTTVIPEGATAHCHAYGTSLNDGLNVSVEGLGPKMLELMCDLKEGQIMAIQGARAHMTPQGILRIMLTENNFAVRTAA